MQQIGKYLVVRELGRGGMGIVYEARDPALDRPVALKLVSERGDPERFLREARAAAKVIHPNCVPIFDIGEHEGNPFLVMELVEGVSAAEFLEKRGPLGWRTATRIVAAACRGLAAVHEAGVIHRDVKPSNLLIAKSGAVKLADFGLARDVGKAAPALTGDQVVGTPHFMSPEQCWKEPVDARSDIYSLGATYYVLLTGRPPYHAPLEVQIMFAHCNDPVPDPRRIERDLPAECAEIVGKAMAKAPADRYKSARELLAALEGALTAVIAEDKRDSSPATAHIGDDTPQPFLGAATQGRVLAASPTGNWAAEPGQRGVTTPGGVAVSTPLAETRPDNPTPVASVPDDARPTRRRWLLAAAPATAAALGLGGYFAFRKPDTPDRPRDKPVVLVPARKIGLGVGLYGSGLAVSANGKRLAVALDDHVNNKNVGGVQLFDRTAGDAPPVWWKWQQEGCNGVAFSPDGKFLAVAIGGTGRLRLVRLEDEHEVRLPLSGENHGIDGNVLAVAFSRDGGLLAASIQRWDDAERNPRAGLVRVWDTKTERHLRDLTVPSPQPARGLSFGANRTLAVAVKLTHGTGAFVSVWKADSGEHLKTIPLLQTILGPCVSFAGDEPLLAVSTQRGVQLYQVASYAEGPHHFPTNDNEPAAVALSPDGTVLAFSVNDAIEVCNAQTGTWRATLREATGAIFAIAFTADSKTLLYAGSDKIVRECPVPVLAPG